MHPKYEKFFSKTVVEVETVSLTLTDDEAWELYSALKEAGFAEYADGTEAFVMSLVRQFTGVDMRAGKSPGTYKPKTRELL